MNGVLQLVQQGQKQQNDIGGMGDMQNQFRDIPQQSVNYGVKQKTNHLGFPQDDDLFGIKDLKTLYKPQKSKKKKHKRHSSILTQGQMKKLKGFLKTTKRAVNNIKYNVISG